MRRSFVAVGSFVVLAVALVRIAPVATAQTAHGKRPKQKPAATVDAGPAGDSPYGDESAAPAGQGVSGGLSATPVDAGPASPPIAHRPSRR